MATKEEIKHAVDTQGTETLPPPGYGRQEALRIRQVRLERAIEQASDLKLMGRLDPEALKPDPYFLAHHDEMSVPHGDFDSYEYLWVETSHRGHHVDLAKRAGYEPVRKDDPDGKDFMQYTPEGYPIVGSAILFRIPLERYINLRAEQLTDYKVKRGDIFNVDKMMEISEKFASRTGKPAIKIIDRFTPDQIRNAQQRAAVRRQRESSWEIINQHLTEGTAHLAYGKQQPSHI